MSTSYRWLLAALFLLLGAYFLFNFSAPETESAYSDGYLETQDNFYDFGSIPLNGGLVSREFVLTNPGLAPVTISKVFTSCMCTVAEVKSATGQFGPFGMPGHGASPRTSITINPGQTVSVVAVFDPAAHGPAGLGLANRSIYLETNSLRSPQLELRFSAVVIN